MQIQNHDTVTNFWLSWTYLQFRNYYNLRYYICIKEVITFCVRNLLHFACITLLHLLHEARLLLQMLLLSVSQYSWQNCQKVKDVSQEATCIFKKVRKQVWGVRASITGNMLCIPLHNYSVLNCEWLTECQYTVTVTFCFQISVLCLLETPHKIGETFTVSVMTNEN